MFKFKKKKVEIVEKFIFSTPYEASSKITEIGAKNIKFDMKPFDGMKIGYGNKYLFIKEKGQWYLRLC